MARHAAGRRAAVDPGHLEGRQREGQVLGALDVTAVLRIHEERGQFRLIEGGEQTGLEIRPLVGVARPLGHEPGDRSARRGPG